MATLRRMVEANDHNWNDICADAEDGFNTVIGNDCEAA